MRVEEGFGERRRGEFAARHQAAGLGDANVVEIASREVSHGMALLAGAEDLRRLGGQAHCLGDALHQAEQADAALMQMADVFSVSVETRSVRRGPETPRALAP